MSQAINISSLETIESDFEDFFCLFAPQVGRVSRGPEPEAHEVASCTSVGPGHCSEDPLPPAGVRDAGLCRGPLPHGKLLTSHHLVTAFREV